MFPRPARYGITYLRASHWIIFLLGFVFGGAVGNGWCHGSDSYNLLLKLFVEEYQQRYVCAAGQESAEWAAYPLTPRYASFEALYYNYLHYLAFPQAVEYPPPRDESVYQSHLAFIIFLKNPVSTQNALKSLHYQSVKPEWFTLQVDGHHPRQAERILDDPIHPIPSVGASRPDSCLALFQREKEPIPVPAGTKIQVRLTLTLPEQSKDIVFHWTLPDEYPFSNPAYESDIWTVVRERYAVMPQPTHAPGREVYTGPPPAKR